MKISKDEVSDLIQALVSEIRVELKSHGIETDSCVLEAAWIAAEKVGLVILKEHNQFPTDFEVNPDYRSE